MSHLYACAGTAEAKAAADQGRASAGGPQAAAGSTHPSPADEDGAGGMGFAGLLGMAEGLPTGTLLHTEHLQVSWGH